MSLRILIVVSILFCSAISAGLIATPLLLGTHSIVSEGSSQELGQTRGRVEEALHGRYEAALSIARVIAAMPRVQRAVEKADTKGLHRLFVKGFDDWAIAAGVSQFQFHTPQAQSILRVHEPDHFGDDLSGYRALVVQANAQQTALAGLERGRSGLGIRGIAPVLQGDDHVGTVEIGLRFDHALIESVVDGSDTWFEVYIPPAEGIEAITPEGENGTRITANYDGPALLNWSDLAPMASDDDELHEIPVGEATYFGTVFPIVDFQGNPVAYGHVLVPDTAYTAISAGIMRTGAIAAAVAFVISLTLALWVGGRLTRALMLLVDRMRRLAGGDTDFALDDVRGRHHETTQMADALEVFRASRLEADRLKAEETMRQADQAQVVQTIAAALHRLSEGDLSTRLPEDLPEGYVALATDFNSAAVALTELAAGIAASSDQITDNTQDLSRATEDLSVRTETNAATLEQASAALQQITESLGTAADEAKGANDSGKSAITKARSGADIVSETVTAMTAIDSSAQEIARITSLIDDIAFQTNLLALNAGVEAARAGSAGSGFAVVAAEVRALAQRTADAARQIGSLIAESGDKVQHGVSLVGRTGSALTDIVDAIETVTEQVARISDLTEQQRGQLTEINVAVSQLDRTTQQNAAMFQQTTVTNRALLDEGERLRRLVSQFEIGGSKSSTTPKDAAAKAPDDPPQETAEAAPPASVYDRDDDGWEAA